MHYKHGKMGEEICYNFINPRCHWLIPTASKKPIDSDVAEPQQERELYETNEKEQIMVPARVVAPHLGEQHPLHSLHKEDPHAQAG